MVFKRCLLMVYFDVSPPPATPWHALSLSQVLRSAGMEAACAGAGGDGAPSVGLRSHGCISQSS